MEVYGRKLNSTDYFLAFLLIANSGFPFFYRYVEWIIITTGIAIVIAANKKVVISKFLFYFLILVTFIIISQTLFTSTAMSILTVLGIYLRIICAYLVSRILGPKLPQLFINNIYFFTIISFFFYTLLLLFPDLIDFFETEVTPFLQSPLYKEESFYNSPHNLIIFELNGIRAYRNSGPFWEPGAFGGFLILGLIYNVIVNRNIINRKNIVFIVAIFTTLSTTTYIALFAFLILYQLFIVRKVKIGFTIPIIFILGYFSFTEFNFLQNKIEYQLEEQTIVDITSKRGRSRFASAILDLNDFTRSPIWGVSKSINVRYKDQNLSSINIHKNNGVTSLLAQYGIIYFIVFFYYAYKGFRLFAIANNRNVHFGIIALFLLFLIGFSESYFQYIFFISLVFFHLEFPFSDQSKK